MEESGLLGQLGIDWKLFLSQAVNFFILLLILKSFVYKPLLSVIKKRNEKIKEGLEKAEEADIRLKEVDNIAKEKLKEADKQSISIIKDTEQRAKQLEQSLTKKAETKQAELLKQVQVSYEKQKEETKKLVSKEAKELVKKFISKTVELRPEAIDEALIEKAVNVIKHEI
jgi:F-type H+-transporting ATPase subunit b